MKPELIVVGRTYANRGMATTTRTVLRIEQGLPCSWHSPNPRPDMPVVEYVDNYVRKGAVYLRSFAAWAELVQPESKQWSDAMLEYMQLCKQIVETNYDTEVPAMQARMRELHPLLTQQEAARVNRTIFRL